MEAPLNMSKSTHPLRNGQCRFGHRRSLCRARLHRVLAALKVGPVRVRAFIVCDPVMWSSRTTSPAFTPSEVSQVPSERPRSRSNLGYLSARLTAAKIGYLRDYLKSDTEILSRCKPFLGERAESLSLSRFRRTSIRDTASWLVYRVVGARLIAFFSCLLILGLVMILYPNPQEAITADETTTPAWQHAVSYAVILAVLAATCGAFVASEVAVRRRFRYGIDEVIRLQYLSLIHQARDPDFLLAARNRTSFAKNLGRLAFLIEYELPRYSKHDNATAQRVAQDHFSQAAGAVHELAVWVMIPQGGTWDALMNRLVESFWSAWDGRWHDLPRLEPRAQPGPRGAMVRKLVASLLPLGVLLILHQLEFVADASVERWAFFLAATWAVLVVVSVLDPGYSSRVTEARELLASLRGKSGSDQ